MRIDVILPEDVGVPLWDFIKKKYDKPHGKLKKTLVDAIKEYLINHKHELEVK